MARTVQVVLTDDLPNVGKSGELVKVRPGFARNFLIPRGLAAAATLRNVAQIEHNKRVAASRAAKLKSEAQELASRLTNVRVQLKAAVGEGEKLYGSITSRDVEEGLAAQGFQVDRRKIIMEPIKVLGSQEIFIKVASGVDAKILVEVIPAS